MLKHGLKMGLLLSFLALAACNTVTAPAPLGNEPVPLTAADWDGRWFNAEAYLDIAVVDPEKGLARIEIAEDDAVQLIDVQLRQSGDWLFVNVTEEDFDNSQGVGEQADENASSAADGERYLWARLRKDGDMITVWRPDPQAFAILVHEGLLPGVTVDSDVALGPLRPEHYEKITSGAFGVVLEWETPTVLYRFRDGKLPVNPD